MKPLDSWNSLNSRQRTYLRSIYTVDQEAEKAEQQRWHCGQQRRSASEWRWLLYGDAPSPTRLKRLLLTADVVDSGTGSTFAALETRKLIWCRHSSDVDWVWVRLTTLGRKVARTGLGEPAPKKIPTGTLREWHWEALAKLYAAGDAGLFDDGIRSGYYGGISWNTWLRLRDYKAGALMKTVRTWDKHGRERYGAAISDFGREFYRQNVARYRELYPFVSAP